MGMWKHHCRSFQMSLSLETRRYQIHGFDYLIDYRYPGLLDFEAGRRWQHVSHHSSRETEGGLTKMQPTAVAAQLPAGSLDAAEAQTLTGSQES